MMPTPPLRPCTVPGCPKRVTAGRCSVHARIAGQQRTGWRELYGSDWPRIRLDYLSRNPVCVLCGQLAGVADHYPRGIRLLRKQQNPEPHADRHLRALCASCHSKETIVREPGGFTTRFT